MSFPNNVIYVTHCSAMKNKDCKGTNLKVTPDKLYTATPTQRFMNNCKNKKIKWAIFSDKYGVWFSDIQNEWYEKNPSKVTEKEFDELIWNFDESLRQFDKIYFYHNP